MKSFFKKMSFFIRNFRRHMTRMSTFSYLTHDRAKKYLETIQKIDKMRGLKMIERKSNSCHFSITKRHILEMMLQQKNKV